MTVERFEQLCARAGLACIGQEQITWEHGRCMTDAFSLFTRLGSRWDRPNRRFRNPGFRDEAERMRSIWAESSFAGRVEGA
jgi:hypothetical protein